MSDRFTLYEADDKHLAIAWGPMTFDKVLAQAFELTLESDDCRYDDIQLRVEDTHLSWALYYNRENKRNSESGITAMMLLCEWLNGQRGGYRHYFTAEEDGVVE